MALPREPTARGAPTSWGVYRLRLVLPLVGTNFDRDHRERQAKGYTNHEVIALRVGGPAGRRFFPNLLG
jgi:hypothetical protein